MSDTPDETLLTKALQQSLPGLKSQAQFNAFAACLEAFLATTNAILNVNPEAEQTARGALDTAFSVVRQATDLTLKLEAVPEAASPTSAAEFLSPPKQFHEYDVHRALLSELAKIEDGSELMTWYSQNRARIDSVVSQSLRNVLFESIREKKISLTSSTS